MVKKAGFESLEKGRRALKQDKNSTNVGFFIKNKNNIGFALLK